MAVVVITGASSGIGAATARLLAAEGHTLVLAARRQDRLEALAAELGSRDRVLPVVTDVTRREDVEALASRAGEAFGRIDVWINNAGVGIPYPWWEQPPEAIVRVVETNLTGAIFGARAAIPWMIRQDGGHIINVGSMAGHVPFFSVYSATKAGLRGFTEGLRRELRPYGIHVSLVSPGFIRTEMTRGISMPGMAPPEVVARAIVRLVARPRREVVVPGWYRLFILLNGLAPGLLDRAVHRMGVYRARTRRDASVAQEQPR